MSKQTKAVFAGTFDPFTIGHYDIAKRAKDLFGSLVVAVGNNAEKKCMFSLEDRLKIAKAGLAKMDIEVMAFDGLLTDFCSKIGSKVIVRGIRTVSDLEYERTIGRIYKSLNQDLEVVFLLNNPEYAHIHGFMVRDLIRYDADINGLVCEGTAQMIYELSKKRV